MLADTFLKRRFSAWNLSISHHGQCHTLVLVKNDSKNTEKLIKYALENTGKDDFITILCVLKLSVTTDILLGRVLEPLGYEDMALTEIQKIVNSYPGQKKVNIKIMSGDPKTVISNIISNLNPDLIVTGSSQRKGIWNQSIPSYLLNNVQSSLYVLK